MPPETGIDAVVDRVAQTPFRQKRRLVALAGPPASGKSTLAEVLCERLADSCVVPMDGFHLDNRMLKARGIQDRKGAPHTFDTAGLTHLLRRLKEEKEVFFPLFDRSIDCSIAGAGYVGPETSTVIVEGNYLLLDAPGWRELAGMWDFSVYLRVPEAELRRRLMERWHAHGFTDEGARSKVENNDLPNARTTVGNLIPPDVALDESALNL